MSKVTVHFVKKQSIDFDNLDQGDFFTYNNDLMYIIEPNGSGYNCVDIEGGNLSELEPDDQVYVVDVVIEVL